MFAPTSRSARTDRPQCATPRTALAERAAATTARAQQGSRSRDGPADEHLGAARLRHPVVQRDDGVDDVEPDILRLVWMQSSLRYRDGAQQRRVAFDRRQLD